MQKFVSAPLCAIVIALSGCGAEPSSPASARAAVPRGPTADGPTYARRGITREGARVAIDAVIAEARRRGTGGAVAVVDEGGNLVAVERADATFPASAEVSIGKARTAALFRHPTAFFENVIREGRTPMIALDDFTPLEGGVPILVGDEVVGAVGVSGASSSAEDAEYAAIGARALTDAATARAHGTTERRDPAQIGG